MSSGPLSTLLLVIEYAVEQMFRRRAKELGIRIEPWRLGNLRGRIATLKTDETVIIVSKRGPWKRPSEDCKPKERCQKTIEMATESSEPAPLP